MPLSDTAVQALKPEPGKRVTKTPDRDGLFLHVAPTGTKSWVLHYKIHGKERSATLGRYPAMSIKKARERTQAVRARLADGIDPVQDKRRQKAVGAAEDAARFGVIADAWRGRQTWTPGTLRQYDRMFEQDITPALGRLPVADIDVAVIEQLVASVAKRGKVVAGHVLLLVVAIR